MTTAMTVAGHYRFQAEVISAAGVSLGEIPISPDWGPAYECCRLQGLRRGHSVPAVRADCVSVAPEWHGKAGEPFVDQVRISVPDACGEPVSCEFPLEYFRAAVEKGAEGLVRSGKLLVGEQFRFRVFAFATAASRSPRAADTDVLEGELLNNDLVIQDRSIGPLRATSQLRGIDSASGDQLPTFIPSHVIDECRELAIASPEIETGTILLGHLCRDPQTSELFLEISAGITARHTIAERHSLTFTAESWVAVDAAIRLRDSGEIIGGWSHSHPWFCAKCDPASRSICPFAKPVFSEADRSVHRTVFGLGFQVAMLLSLYGDEVGPACDLFGWSSGSIRAHEYYVV